MEGKADVVSQECASGYGGTVMCCYVFCTLWETAFVGEVMVDDETRVRFGYQRRCFATALVEDEYVRW